MTKEARLQNWTLLLCYNSVKHSTDLVEAGLTVELFRGMGHQGVLTKDTEKKIIMLKFQILEKNQITFIQWTIQEHVTRSMYRKTYWFKNNALYVILAESVPILATSPAVQSFTITKVVLSNTLHFTLLRLLKPNDHLSFIALIYLTNTEFYYHHGTNTLK